ncbi:MAG: TraB/GumN family protein [Gammaproteobacteria bacterium]|nr:TraB/GumN family protein [Gammaproteobacteria bacterium]MBT8134019.1 TraB/GumN family protein [Gammaproteobacteria bacterium]NNJ50812.1 TraB/GumN family protein [Gammaproteobacteria bacterium]
MKKWLLLVLYFSFCSYAVAENDRAFFWQVTSDQSAAEQVNVYLMGSIHFADQSFYPLRADIEQAFERSEYLAVELDVNAIDQDAYNRMLSRKGVFPEGKSIKDSVSDETWQQLRARLRQLNISYEAVQNYKPGMLVLTMTAIQVMQMGLDPQLGIDMHFLRKAASPPEKKIIELETLEQQLDLFIDIPDGDLLLKETLYSMAETESIMNDMVSYWKTGDQSSMNRLLFEDALDDYPSFSSIYDRLFHQRNRNMVSKIEGMLQQGKAAGASYFVVVGSGHLIGDEGIVNMLKQKGYKVKRL